MLFDWLVTGQVIPSNPAHAVRGPRYSVSKGVAPLLSSEEAGELLKSMDVSTVVGLRGRRAYYRRRRRRRRSQGATVPFGDLRNRPTVRQADHARRWVAPSDAGIETAIGCYHPFCATGITDYVKNGGRVEIARRMAGHSNAKATGLDDRRNDEVSLDEVKRIGI